MIPVNQPISDSVRLSLSLRQLLADVDVCMTRHGFRLTLSWKSNGAPVPLATTLDSELQTAAPMLIAAYLNECPVCSSRLDHEQGYYFCESDTVHFGWTTRRTKQDGHQATQP